MRQSPQDPFSSAVHFVKSFYEHPGETIHLMNSGLHAPSTILPTWRKFAAVGLIALGGAVMGEGVILQDLEGLALGSIDTAYGSDILLQAGEEIAKLPPGGGGAPGSHLS